jgi:hypothetical protein
MNHLPSTQPVPDSTRPAGPSTGAAETTSVLTRRRARWWRPAAGGLAALTALTLAGTGMTKASATVLPASATSPAVAVVGGGQGTSGTPVTAPALSGKYAGTLNADFGTTAPITMTVAGSPSNLTVTTEIGTGAQVDCNGTQSVPSLAFTMTGVRTGVNADGSSTYHLTGQQSFEDNPYPTVSITVTVNVDANGAILSSDGKSFSGPVVLGVHPSEYGSDCTRNWSFAETLATTPVPNVVHKTQAQAQQILLAAGLHPVLTDKVDPTCNNLGSVLSTNPQAGTVVPPGTNVTVTIGTRPTKTLCP